jgi:hypothetical protein
MMTLDSLAASAWRTIFGSHELMIWDSQWFLDIVLFQFRYYTKKAREAEGYTSSCSLLAIYGYASPIKFAPQTEIIKVLSSAHMAPFLNFAALEMCVQLSFMFSIH